MACFDTSVVGETASQRIAGAQITGNRTWLLDSTLTGTGLRVDAASVGSGTAVVAGVTTDAVLMACWTAELGPDRVWIVEGRACETYLLKSVEGGAESVSLKKVVRHVGGLDSLRVTARVGSLCPGRSADRSAAGFALWTFMVMSGAMWAEHAWGRFWGWDPKEVRSFVIWILYAAYLHARTTQGWAGRRAAWLAIWGHVAIELSFAVVNLYVRRLHSYPGLEKRELTEHHHSW